jgi:hypothetical protein
MKKKKRKVEKNKKFSTGFLHKCTKNGVFWKEYASFPHNPQTFPQFYTGCGKGCGKLFTPFFAIHLTNTNFCGIISERGKL